MCKVIEIPKIFAANGDHNIQSIKVFEGGNGCFIGDKKLYEKVWCTVLQPGRRESVY